jgi:hypothetical protein
LDSAKDLAVIVVNRNRPDLTDRLVEQIHCFGPEKDKDVIVVECGSDPDKRSRYATFWYDDPDFSGKCYGHNQGLVYLQKNGLRYRYYWFIMNDVLFESEPDPIDHLLLTLDSNPRMGLISPTERDSDYPGARPRAGSRWHKVATCDYLALMIKHECLREVGFLNPQFKYSWGAIHELSYKMYSRDWFLAYSDDVTMRHLGGTTYGAAAGTVPRNEYIENAKCWAAKYFRDNYGSRWDEKFAAALQADVEINTYSIHRRLWECAEPKTLSLWNRMIDLFKSMQQPFSGRSVGKNSNFL